MELSKQITQLHAKLKRKKKFSLVNRQKQQFFRFLKSDLNESNICLIRLSSTEFRLITSKMP
jgi:hypothetical protein